MFKNDILQLTVTLFFCPFLLATGCDKETEANAYKMKEIFVAEKSLEMVVGDVKQLSAKPVPSVAHAPAFQWASSDNSVATVTAGLVQAVGAGTATIVVSYQDLKTEVSVTVKGIDTGNFALLYDLRPSPVNSPSELQLNGAGKVTNDGLVVDAKGNLVKLDKFYALAERMVRYVIRPLSDTKARFASSQGDFTADVDVPNKTISIATSPPVEVSVPFLKGDADYRVEVYHIYQTARVVVTDLQTGERATATATMDGQGGCGKGALQPGFYVGMQWDHYCFGLVSGGPYLVKRIDVFALKKSAKLLIYGDSITQPEGYFPTAMFPDAWTQRIIAHLDGNGISSGRGGCTIHEVLNYIKNELPYIDAKYVMVTIGTNGGNTEANLSELVEYIKLQGCIPILNNIPSNESGTQVENAALIEKVRQKYEIKGCKFDLATSLAGDGKQVDQSMMFWEDYTGSYGWQIYHHPNDKGGEAMFNRTLVDVPEIYQ